LTPPPPPAKTMITVLQRESFVGEDGHLGKSWRPKAFCDIRRKRRGNHPIERAIMEVVREGLNAMPGRVGKVVVAEEGLLQMSAFPMEPEASREFRRDPHVHKASVPDEEPTFRFLYLRADQNAGELNLGNPAEIVEGSHGRLLSASRIFASFGFEMVKGKEVFESLSLSNLPFLNCGIKLLDGPDTVLWRQQEELRLHLPPSVSR
jgi:hypothetical protein